MLHKLHKGHTDHWLGDGVSTAISTLFSSIISFGLFNITPDPRLHGIKTIIEILKKESNYWEKADYEKARNLAPQYYKEGSGRPDGNGLINYMRI